MRQKSCEMHVQDVTYKSAEVCDPSTTHGIAITSLYVTRQHSVKWVSVY